MFLRKATSNAAKVQILLYFSKRLSMIFHRSVESITVENKVDNHLFLIAAHLYCDAEWSKNRRN